jgi:hypothetical protein
VAVKKLSQIAPAGAAPAPTDVLVGVLSGSTDALVSINQLRVSINYLYQNIKDDWGATGNGVTDDTAAFLNFQTFAQAQTARLVLVIPPGTYVIGVVPWYKGIADLTIIGYGATITNFANNGPFFQQPVGVQSARIASTNVGDGAVFLITPSQHTIFTVGSIVAVTSFEMQGVGGYPPNFYYCEFKKITSKNTTLGEIFFDSVLSYSHLSTYPEPNISFGSFSYDVGGPASIFNLQTFWVQNVKVYGLKIQGQADTWAQFMYFKDCIFDGNVSMSPSVAEQLVYENCIFTTTIPFIEVDKDISLCKFIDCGSRHQ